MQCVGVCQLVTLAELTLKTCKISTLLRRVQSSQLKRHKSLKRLQQEQQEEIGTESNVDSSSVSQGHFDSRLDSLSRATKYLYAFALVFIVAYPLSLFASYYNMV